MFPAPVENLTQKPPVHPFHRHVHPALPIIRQNLDHAGVIQFPPDFGFTLEAVKKQRVGFHFRMRDLNGYRKACAKIRGAENGGHTAASNEAFNPVMVELIAGME
jgi:hypothetical protein